MTQKLEETVYQYANLMKKKKAHQKEAQLVTGSPNNVVREAEEEHEEDGHSAKDNSIN